MKKTLLALFGFVCLSFTGTAQSQSASTPQKAEPTELVFKSEQEKQDQIKQTENAIQVRLSNGRTKAELRPLYAKLERIKNAKIEENEK